MDACLAGRVHTRQPPNRNRAAGPLRPLHPLGNGARACYRASGGPQCYMIQRCGLSARGCHEA
eukprot:1418248-Prymnesium_polylepis.1